MFFIETIQAVADLFPSSFSFLHPFLSIFLWHLKESDFAFSLLVGAIKKSQTELFKFSCSISQDGMTEIFKKRDKNNC